MTARIVAPPRAATAFSPIIPNERGILRLRKAASRDQTRTFCSPREPHPANTG
jgi:hypothetical protein